MSTLASSPSVEFPPPPNLTSHIVRIKHQYSEGGSFGDVYRCRYLGGSASIEVAVKAFRFKFAIDGDAEDKSIKMLRRELGIWRRLKHGNIVPFLGVAYGFGMDGTMSLVSLWMQNESLHKFLARYDGDLGMQHRLQFLLDVANGLDYLHSFKFPIVHGDLNCNNVLLDVNYTARLADFGFASLLGNTPDALAYLQRSTIRPGALRWAAPELVNPDETFTRTTKSDIYSFGCIALQVLSGRQPWSEIREDMTVVFRLAMGQKPGRPSSRAIDDSHWGLIQACWSAMEERPTTGMIISAIRGFSSCRLQFPHVCDMFMSGTSRADADMDLPPSSVGQAMREDLRNVNRTSAGEGPSIWPQEVLKPPMQSTHDGSLQRHLLVQSGVEDGPPHSEWLRQQIELGHTAPQDLHAMEGLEWSNPFLDMDGVANWRWQQFHTSLDSPFVPRHWRSPDSSQSFRVPPASHSSSFYGQQQLQSQQSPVSPLSGQHVISLSNVAEFRRPGVVNGQGTVPVSSPTAYESPFSFHPPPLVESTTYGGSVEAQDGGPHQESNGARPGTSEYEHGSESRPQSRRLTIQELCNDTDADGRVRSFSSNTAGSASRPTTSSGSVSSTSAGEYGSQSRPQSRRLTVQELCNDTDVNGGIRSFLSNATGSPFRSSTTESSGFVSSASVDEYGSRSRPQSRRLTVQELCNDVDTNGGT